jgi:3-methylcrotonyl-CoA carboxylase alpha subunit
MKMEHAICAPRDGTVSDVLCQPGEQVSEGQELLRLHALPCQERP